MSKRKVLVMGAGVYQVPLIEKAKEQGLHVIVASIEGNYPGIPLADEFWAVDTRDADRVVELAREAEIDGVLTTGTDVAVPTIGAVVDALGLVGTGYDAALKCMNKSLMKDAFQEHGVPSARFVKARNLEEALAAANSIGYPVMVKAVDSSGSRGITKADADADMPAAWENARAVSKDDYILVEEYLDGIEFGAQAIVHGDRVVAVFPHNDTVTPPPLCAPVGHSIPSDLSEDQIQQTWVAIESAVKALGMRDCVSNVDLTLVNGEVRMIEIGARMGATGLAENVALYTGMDIYGHILAICMGEYLDIPQGPQQANAVTLIRSDKAGTVERVEVPEDVQKHPAVRFLRVDIEPGDQVNAFKVGPDRCGDIVVVADTAAEAETLVEELAAKVVIHLR